jgi:CelD/BcsL family acetyltransferase involved in cellulose biosynthesis
MVAGVSLARYRLRQRATTRVSARLVLTEADVLALEPKWNELRANLAAPSPYTDWSYVIEWWRTFAPKAQPVFITVEDDGLVLGILPMFVDRAGPLGFRRLRPIGFNGELGPDDMTEEPIILIRDGYEERVITAGLRALRTTAIWDTCVIRALGPAVGKAVRAARTASPLGALPVKLKKGPMVVHLPATWAEYRKQISKSMRDNLGYYPRLLDRHGHTWNLRMVSSGPELAEGLDHLVRLHRARVTSAADHRNHLPTAMQIGFLARVHEDLGLEAKAFVSLLEVDGEVVAAQSFYEDRGTLLVNYSGFDPAWGAYSPLFIIQAEVFKAAQSRGTRTINFLQGDRAWQKRWNGENEGELAHLAILRLNPISLLRAAAYAVKHESSALARRRTAKRVAKSAAAKG